MILKQFLLIFKKQLEKLSNTFGKKIGEADLDYKRENKLEKILNRGEIKGRIEFEYVTDM